MHRLSSVSENLNLATTTRVFIDTHVVTLFKFLENPDQFIPSDEGEVYFMITLPVVRELERIKNEHYSKGQRSRARKCLELLEESEYPAGRELTPRSHLYFSWQEPTERGLREGGLSTPQTPDEFFVAAVYRSFQHATDPSYKTFVMSDDFGVRMRVKHFFRGERVTAIRPPQLRYQEESFELPRLVQETVKNLAKEIGASLRLLEATDSAGQEPSPDKR